MKYIIEKQYPVLAIWTYEVDAESEEKAMEQILSGDVEPQTYKIEPMWDWDEDDVQYSVI
tara:strand:- start:203 stop:382 length:180 start_codon:yes stop_codon:yes gene_type:complete